MPFDEWFPDGLPDWYLLVKDAQLYGELGIHVTPWDLMREAPYWRGVAQAMRQIENKVAELKRD